MECAWPLILDLKPCKDTIISTYLQYRLSSKLYTKRLVCYGQTLFREK